MIVTNIVLRTLFIVFTGFLIIAVLCVNELLNGTGLSHPIWDKTYSWLPLLKDILYISFVGALLSEAASADKLGHEPVRKTAVKGGYQYGH